MTSPFKLCRHCGRPAWGLTKGLNWMTRLCRACKQSPKLLDWYQKHLADGRMGEIYTRGVKTKHACKHCRRLTNSYRRRGLCYWCYASPVIRRRSRSASPSGAWAYRDDDVPTIARGEVGTLEALQRRVALRLPLFGG